MKNLIELMAGILFGGVFFGLLLVLPVTMMWLAEKNSIVFWGVIGTFAFVYGRRVVRNVKDYINE